MRQCTCDTTSVTNVGCTDPCGAPDCVFGPKIVPRDKMPTPLYVTDGGRKKVLLSYNTQEEADAAYRILSALAAIHANAANAIREIEENPHLKLTAAKLIQHE